MPSAKTSIPLESGKYYHIYNKGIDGIPIFYQKKKYFYFLNKFKFYLNNYIDVYAYCLIPNHFHFLIKVKDTNSFSNSIPISKQVSEQFRKFFITYSQAINKQEGRMGSLFIRHFKRIQINSDKYFKDLIFYIHYNPVKHNICDKFENYPYSSYSSTISKKFTILKRNEIFEWFNNKKEFIDFHNIKHEIKVELSLENN